MTEYLTIRTKHSDGAELEQLERDTLAPLLSDTLKVADTLLQAYEATERRWRELGTPYAAETADQVTVHLDDAVKAIQAALAEATRWEAGA